jgi:glycosyltransferase involved in cell wall biosynthesis
MACANYWTSPYQVGSHQIARAFVSEGWDVAYVSDPISILHLFSGKRKELKERLEISRGKGKFFFENKLWTYLPFSLLTHQNKPILKSDWISQHWHKLTIPDVLSVVKNMGFEKVDLLYFDNGHQNFWKNHLTYKKSLFRMADNNSGYPTFTTALDRRERELASEVDIVLYTALSLEARVSSMKPKSMLYFPNGVEFSNFVKKPLAFPEEYRKIPKPIALYVGELELRIDYELINKAAQALPDISFVFIGPEGYGAKKIKRLKNIFILGRKEYDQLFAYMVNADVGLIPFNSLKFPDLINNVNPLKMYQYFACGLPVVAMEWAEIKKIGSPAIIAKTHDEFIQSVQYACHLKSNKEQYIQFASQHDWTAKVKNLIKLLEDN